MLLKLAYDYAKKTNQLYKFGVYHLDYEAQYQYTTDFVEKTLQNFLKEGIDVYHFCLPIAAECATSMFQTHWTPWHPDQEEI